MRSVASALAVFLMSATLGESATLQVQAIASASGVDVSSGLVGGTDNQAISTNTASGSASGTVSASSSTSVASASAFASADVATGQLKASVSGNPGTYYHNIPSSPVWASQVVVSANALVSETFVAVGSGTVQFDLAFNGNWNIAPQPYLMCCDPVLGVVAGFYQPQWLLSGSIALGGSGGLLAGDGFAYVSPNDPLQGSISGVLSIMATLVDGADYGISAALDTFFFDGIGGIDFSHTATLSYSASPGVSLLFSDSRFLTIDPNSPAPVPLPAGAVLLGSALFGFGAVASKRRQSKP